MKRRENLKTKFLVGSLPAEDGTWWLHSIFFQKILESHENKMQYKKKKR